jgi:adenine phosphoribosyltransferase
MGVPNTYGLNIAGLERELPVVAAAPGLFIASFVLLGDTQLVEAAAEALAKVLSRRCRLAPGDTEYIEDIELLVCPEAKAIPLTHALAVRLGLDYVVLRKSVKPYMQNPLLENTRSITTDRDQTLVLDGRDSEKLRGKRVCLVDDVVSTGGSLASAERLLARVPCKVSARAAILLEGPHPRPDLIYLETLPLFPET